jgi:hypothetical protein
METLGLRTASWSSGPVLLAITFRERRRGLCPRPAGRSMLIRGNSVHGIGMEEPLTVIGIDPGGRVVGVRRLRPRTLVVMPGARWLLEQPVELPAPRRGEVLSIVNPCPGS